MDATIISPNAAPGGAALPVLRSQASRYAIYGTCIALVSVVLATLLVAQYVYGEISIANIITAQLQNVALWTMDAMPFVFALWGQYASFRMARTASTIVKDSTLTLREALTTANSVSRAKSDFFAKMSHELRTPINAIIGMSELLHEAPLEAPHARHAGIINAAAKNLLTLINDVLDYSKIEAGWLQLDMIEFDLEDCINNAVGLLAPQAQAKGLALDVELEPALPRKLNGDPGRLRQILINLLGNAIKYTSAGRVALRVACVDTRGATARLAIEIEDTGVGIAPEAQAVLFEPYRRIAEAGADRSASATTGTGLGLAITRELVSAMNGDIGVRSEIGKGSVFRCTVTLSVSGEPALARLAGDVDLTGVKLLLADDNEVTRSILAAQLRALGLVVHEAGDGLRALEMIVSSARSKRPFEILITDMFLPSLDGEELGRRLQSRPATSGVVLAMMTAAGARGDAERLRHCGFTGYISRPVAESDLKSFLCHMLATVRLTPTQREHVGVITRYTLGETTPRNRRVLVVEDSDVNREITVSQLARLGLKSDVAATGAAAVEAARLKPYGALLMDLRLPDSSGARVIGAIRRLSGDRGRVPILVLTAGVTEVETQQCRTLGVKDVLLKPIETEALGRALEPYVGPPTAAAPTVPSAAPDRTLIEIFLREAAQRMAAIKSAPKDAGGAEIVARHAHTLRGNCGHLGEDAMGAIAARVEQLARDGGPGMDAAISSLDKAYMALKARLEASVADKTAAPA